MLKELINRFAGNFGDRLSAEFPNASISAEIIQDYNKARKTGAGASACFAPSVNMLFSQSGKVKACCHNTTYVLGEYPKQSIAEIWRSPAALELRSHMKNYNLSHGCDICAADLKNHDYAEVRARHFDAVPRNEHYPTMMEFLLSNTCNLECVMCQGEYSSLIRKNREKLAPIVSPYDRAFINQLEEFIPHLHETRFSGSGEAFAIDTYYEIWEMIVRTNPDCIIMVQTNGSYLNGRIKDLLSRGNFRIGVSLDSLKKEVFESIRLNADFERVIENIRYFSEYCKNKNQKFALAMCVMRQNWRELPDFIRFCNDNNAVATLHKVWFPMEYSLHNLPYPELNEICSFLERFDPPSGSRLQNLNRQHYRYTVSSIKSWMENARQNKTDDFITSSVLKWRETTFSGQSEVSDTGMDSHELMALLQDKIKTALMEDGAGPPDITEVTALCHEKITAVIAVYETETERENILKQICSVPVREIIISLRQASVESMIERSRLFLESN